MIAHINIGSNIGNRAENINRAVSLLDRIGKVTAISQSIETDPWGYESTNKFLNLGVNVETDLNALKIITHLKNIEKLIDPNGLHRNARGCYADRIIDLDLIALDELIDNNPEATIPHPRMAMRDFVVQPMAQILPGWKHPRLKKNIEKILSELYNKPTSESVK